MLRNFWRSLLAVLLGNAVYFLLMPHLPPDVRHAPNRLDPGLGLDFLICAAIYILINLLDRRRSRRAEDPGRR